MIKEWDDLPEFLKNDEVRKYYEILKKKKFQLALKRVFDVIFSVSLLILLIPVFIVVSILILIDSGRPVIFKQTRVTQYGRTYNIFKFRTMINEADKINQVTIKDDPRITKVGNILRKFRIDEIPQLINIISGDMSFVGTRPEVVKYVDRYTDEMKATLLLPAGVTSEASILFRDEALLLSDVKNSDDIYINEILPQKMEINLRSIEKFSLLDELKIIFKTIVSVVKN